MTTAVTLTNISAAGRSWKPRALCQIRQIRVEPGKSHWYGFTMRRAPGFLLILSMIWLGVQAVLADPVTGRVVKVLPFHLDLEGRNTPSPSLFDRDAYQDQLRKNPAQCSALRFDVQWKARSARDAQLRLRVEMITSASTKARPIVVERPVEARSGGKRWTQLTLQGDAFRQAGELIAWRVSLLEGESVLAEQTSFLW